MLAAKGAFREAFMRADPVILEPVMDVSLTSPSEFQGACIALINRRKGSINDSEVSNDNLQVSSRVSLNNMFGFSTDIRSITQV
jgi:elongation factor G